MSAGNFYAVAKKSCGAEAALSKGGVGKVAEICLPTMTA